MLYLLMLVIAGIRQRGVDWAQSAAVGVSTFALVAIALAFVLDYADSSGKPASTFGGVNQFAATLAISAGFATWLALAVSNWMRWLGLMA